ncbi:deacetylase [Saccharobesus litoralis]|uniref:Deacetylase n=1 Tax=Saccharobesus litoralis TaxID=2172099 RepID=A0A2S0VMG7_9ALTE|nr:histone deacetylase family protein [Saccharobesus litoralis]AWB65413.1 deacetylase [Saccharobesus litoralis]
MSFTIISHHQCRQHKVPDWFVECPERIDAINNQIIASGLEFGVQHLDAKKVTPQQLERVHDKAYLTSLAEQVPTQGINMLSDDLPLSPKTLLAAQYAAGSGVQAVDLLMLGKAKGVFCNVRPPGHHAERQQALGFCFYNNIAVAAAYAMDAYGLQRIAIVDFDVHHGNGTQDIFEDDPRVWFSSVYQDKLFPATTYHSYGENIVNLPLAAPCTSQQWREALEKGCLDKLAAFQPEMIFISAGFDAHLEDDISNFQLTESDYAWLSSELRAIKDRTGSCLGIVSMLEGGYNLSALGRSVVAHIKALAKL